MTKSINYSQTFQNTYTTNSLKPVRKIKKTQAKTIDKIALAFVLGFSVFVSCCVAPFSYKNFISPLFTNTNVMPFKVDLKKVYSPTSAYLHNNEFLGTSTLKGANIDAPLMKEIILTDHMLYLENQLKALSYNYKTIHPSVFVWDVDTGKYASLNSKEQFAAASIIKIPVLLQMFRSIEAGQLDINDTMELTDFYRAEGSGDLQFQRTGNQYSMDTLARKMIQISDNSSTNMIMSSIGGMNDVNRAVKNWGLKDTEINNWLPDMKGTNVTTTEDLVRMLYNIENDSFLSPESKEKIFDYMGHVKNNRLIHAGLNPNAKFYHKTGDIGHMLGDAGIVITPNGHKYYVAILANRPYNHHAGKEFIVRASSLIYERLANRQLT